MTTASMRQLLLNYLAKAEEDKVKAIHTLLKNEIKAADAFVLTDEQYEILELERELHLSGKSRSYTRDEARKIIKG